MTCRTYTYMSLLVAGGWVYTMLRLKNICALHPSSFILLLPEYFPTRSHDKVYQHFANRGRFYDRPTDKEKFDISRIFHIYKYSVWSNTHPFRYKGRSRPNGLKKTINTWLDDRLPP